MSLKVIKHFDLQKRLAVIYNGDYRAFLTMGADEIIKDNINNIKHQITPDGGELKKNSEETMRIKKRLGKGTLSLIWDRVLISPGTWVYKKTKKNVQIFLAPVRAEIGRQVRAMGYDFFGISDKARVLILNRWRDFIKAGLR